MIFRNPFFLILIPVIPALFLFFRKKGKNEGAVRYSSVAHLKGVGSSRRAYWAQHLPWLRLTFLILMVIALARPQIGLKDTIVRREGIDIVLVLDVSTSMLAEDFIIKGARQNRLEIVKKVTSDFIAKRPNDRIGIVIFAGRPYILSPLTWDHDFIETRLREIEAGMIEDGTAIGSALTTAVNRLRESETKSKVIILLTDGVNNAGNIHPETAGEAAAALEITVFTIGAGSDGPVPYPVIDNWGRKVYQKVQIGLDEDLLKQVAEKTGGEYFHANDTDSLVTIFHRIDKMTKSPLKMPIYREYRELYPYLLLAALFLICLETILNNTVFRRLP